MKIFKKILCAVLALCLALPAVACGDDGLDIPTGIGLDSEYLLSWEEVQNARYYEVEITDAASGQPTVNTARRTSYSLSDLAEGDYSVRLRAVGGNRSDIFSEWTETLEFHRDYESGLIYSAINNNTEYAVMRVGRARGDVVIEDVYRGKPVTAIADAAFRSAGDSLTSIVIGQNIRTIGASAFYNCTGLTRVVMSDSVVSIGSSAFQNCRALEEIELPESVTSLPEYAFAHCTSLRNVVFGEKLVSIGEAAFTDCNALTSLSFPASLTAIGKNAFNENNALAEITFAENITAISSYAFYGCGMLEAVNFPERLAEGVSLTLGPYAFSDCDALTRVVLPDGTAGIGEGTFSYSASFDEIVIPESVGSVGHDAFTDTALTNKQEGADAIYAGDWLLSISDDLFDSITTLDSAVFNMDTVGIADYAFIRTTGAGYSGCPQLTTITLPASVKYIGRYAFYNSGHLSQFAATTGGLRKVDEYAFALCSTLSNVRFSEGLLEIGQYAFYQCEMLFNNTQNPRVLVPASVNRIGKRAFQNSGLWGMAVEGVVYAGNWVVGYTGNAATVNLTESGSGTIDGISDYAFYNASGVENIVGLSGARHIGVGAFYGCTALLTVTINQNVDAIGAYTFYGCSSLTRFTFNRAVETIDRYAFYQSGLVSISLTSVTTIGNRAFYGCANLQTANLGTRLEYIGPRAFYGCTRLTNVVIPGSVREIGSSAFAKCMIGTLTIENGVEIIGENAFRSTLVVAVRIPDSVKSIGMAAFYGNIFNTVIDLGNGVERIGAYAFGNNALAYGSVVIPESVKEIGAYAFMGCASLRCAIFRGNVTEIGLHAFYLCSHLTVYTADGVELPQGGWNSYFRPVVSGCTLSDDGTFVVSVTTGKTQYFTALGGPSAPVRDGFDFMGWSTEQGGEPVYQMGDLSTLPEGVTLYAIYRFHVETEAPEEGADGQE